MSACGVELTQRNPLVEQRVRVRDKLLPNGDYLIAVPFQIGVPVVRRERTRRDFLPVCEPMCGDFVSRLKNHPERVAPAAESDLNPSACTSIDYEYGLAAGL
jgi:hypothetical protein